MVSFVLSVKFRFIMRNILLALLTTSALVILFQIFANLNSLNPSRSKHIKINPIHFIVDMWIIVTKMHYFAFFNIELNLSFFRLGM